MLTHYFRHSPRPTRQDNADRRAQRPLPRTLVRVLDCDRAQIDKVTEALFGARR